MYIFINQKPSFNWSRIVSTKSIFSWDQTSITILCFRAETQCSKDSHKGSLRRSKGLFQTISSRVFLRLPRGTPCAGREVAFWPVCHPLKTCGSPRLSTRSRRIRSSPRKHFEFCVLRTEVLTFIWYDNFLIILSLGNSVELSKHLTPKNYKLLLTAIFPFV